jgi:peptidoglycan/xylan/chitin deacetylase (PgdA/CDA1 family)
MFSLIVVSFLTSLAESLKYPSKIRYKTPMTFPTIHPIARARGLHKQGIPLLVWHDIVPQEKLVWFDTTIAQFDAQLRILEKSGAHPLSLDALYSLLVTGKPPSSRKNCVLCFDDNTVGIHEYALPRLKKRGWPFVLSVHSAYIGVRTSKSHCTQEMLKECERGGATIVSQTHSHPPDLRLLSDVALKEEMTRSRRILEQQLGHLVRFVTYPSGKWDTRVARAAQEAGYVLGLTEDHGVAEVSPHLLALNRYSTHKRFAEAVRQIK